MFCFVFQDALEYERYLKEVVNALETDPEFRKKLDNATDVDIRVMNTNYHFWIRNFEITL